MVVRSAWCELLEERLKQEGGKEEAEEEEHDDDVLKPR